MSLLCCHCERPLEGHEDKACRRRLSRRRFFYGILGGAAALAMAPDDISGVAIARRAQREIFSRWAPRSKPALRVGDIVTFGNIPISPSQEFRVIQVVESMEGLSFQVEPVRLRIPAEFSVRVQS